MADQCYAMVRGSGLRVTGLGPRGDLPDPIRFAAAKCVAAVRINEVTEAGSDELLRTEQDKPRLRLLRPEETIRYVVDIDFLRTDPGVLNLVSGMPLVYTPDGQLGFGEGGFGQGSFSGVSTVGFDADVRVPAASFALEVWSKLAGRVCAETGQRQYGYTLFPFLKGGRLSGFEFNNGLVSFNLRGAQTRRGNRWAVGPYDLEGTHERMTSHVSRNNNWRTFITTAPPPPQTDGIQRFEDVIDGGTAASTTADILDGGSAASAGPWIVNGGRA